MDVDANLRKIRYFDEQLAATELTPEQQELTTKHRLVMLEQKQVGMGTGAFSRIARKRVKRPCSLVAGSRTLAWCDAQGCCSPESKSSLAAMH